MSNNIAKFALSGVAAAVLSANAVAGTVTSDGADIKIKTKGGGLAIETADGAHSVKVGGRIQLDYNQYSDAMQYTNKGDTGSDLFFRRARLYLAGTLFHDWAYKAQFNIGEDDGGSAEDLYIRWQKYSMAKITMGKHKEPYSLNELTSSKYITAMERTASSGLFAPGRNVGISLQGASDFWGYGIGIYDTGDKNAKSAVNWAYTGRAFLSPINSDNAVLHIGVAGTSRNTEDSGLDGESVSQGISKADKVSFAFDDAKSLQSYNVEIAGKIGPVHAQGEYFQGETKADVGEDAKYNGYYGQVGWLITGESRPYKKGVWNKIKPNNKGLGAWELFARLDSVDFDDGGVAAADRNKQTITTVGVNWYPYTNLRFSANYVMNGWSEDLVVLDGGDPAAPTGETEDKGSGFALRAQWFF